MDTGQGRAGSGRGEARRGGTGRGVAGRAGRSRVLCGRIGLGFAVVMLCLAGRLL